MSGRILASYFLGKRWEFPGIGPPLLLLALICQAPSAVSFNMKCVLMYVLNNESYAEAQALVEANLSAILDLFASYPSLMSRPWAMSFLKACALHPSPPVLMPSGP